jgi:hypothetical protein
MLSGALAVVPDYSLGDVDAGAVPEPAVVVISAVVSPAGRKEQPLRRTGRRRLSPVGNGLDGDVFWLIAGRGRRCSYVANLTARPRVPGQGGPALACRHCQVRRRRRAHRPGLSGPGQRAH